MMNTWVRFLREWISFSNKVLLEVCFFCMLGSFAVLSDYSMIAVTRKLSKHDEHGTLRELRDVIEFSASSLTTPAIAMELQAKYVSEQAKDALVQMHSSPSSVGPINNAINEIDSMMNVVSLTNTWDPLLKNIKLFTKIVDGIADVRHICDWILDIF